MKEPPKIGLDEFRRRRQELMALMADNSVAILPSGRMMMRNSDVDFLFRQDSNFHYLTGFGEPESVLVLIPGREHGESILFCRERDPDLEQWHGRMTGPDRAMQLYQLDDAFPISDIDDILPGLIEGRSQLYHQMGVDGGFDNRVLGWVNGLRNNRQGGAQPPGELIQLGQYVHELRLFKSAQEVAVMKHAAKVTAQGHRRLMEIAEPGMNEHRFEVELNYQFGLGGVRSPAYPSIVGAGVNACILHYIENNQPMAKGDLVLVDAGAEYEHYASDVTRTFPVDGRFSDAQRALYEVVLAANIAAIDKVLPGNHWNEPHEAATRVITEGLVALGILEGEVEALMEDEAFKPFYMHRTGHWLGLDVHDVGEYKVGDAWRVFEPGMVTTVEPGIYIPEDADVPRQFRGIGIRIEDDVLVTRKGNEVITADVPKNIDDIESFMAEA
ncbi:MAG: Xaa-Pro aminopeptidase [Gammaproteobacteria bacterium]|nr:Xaa-Pro aminopeptidase [Gammaproteobacteria bacterium]